MNFLLHSLSLFHRPQPRTAGGIHGFVDLRFYLVLLLYTGAFLTFASDSFFQQDGRFLYSQGMLAIFTSFILTATFSWELLFFGRASGANLLLQIAQIPPLALLIARLTGGTSQLPGTRPVLRQLFQYLQSVDREIFHISGMIPDWLTDLFTNWRTGALLIVVLFLLSLKSVRFKTGGILMVAMVLFGAALAAKPSVPLLAGTLLFGIGATLQFHRYDRTVFFENIVRKLSRNDRCDPVFTATVLAVMTAMYENGRVSREQLSELVREKYAGNDNFTPENRRNIAGEIARRMVFQYNLAEVKFSSDGEFLTPDSRLYAYENLLGAAAVFPRVVLAVTAALIWILLPVDLVPDGIPFFGVLDDVAATIFSGIILRNAFPGK